MALKALHCRICGGTLKILNNGIYQCENNSSHQFKAQNIAEQREELLSLFGEALYLQKEERIANLRSNLWQAAHSEFIDKELIKSRSNQILGYIQNDSISGFYKIACSENKKELCDYLNNSTTEEIEWCADEVIAFCIKILSQEILLSLNNYIQRAYENSNPKKYGEWMSRLAPEAQRVDDGVYDVTIPRDVFIAYKSEDMKAVAELTDYLENVEGMMCFVAARNLQHGWISDYESKLERAIDNCRAVVFVSTVQSRKLGDARKKELPYVRNNDIKTAPPEYKQRGYKTLLRGYKKPRVEYVVEGYPQNKSASDIWVNEFFDGFERATQPVEVARQLNEQFSAAIEAETDVVRNQREIEEERKRVAQENERNRKAQEELLRKQKELEEQLRKKLEAEYKEKFPMQKTTTKIKVQGDYFVGNKYVLDGKQTAELIGRQIDEKLSSSQSQIKAFGNYIENNSPVAANVYPPLDRHTKKDFKIDGSVLLKKYTGKKTVVQIPQGIKKIYHRAFSGCKKITYILIPDGVTAIGDGTFEGCSSLKSIAIPDSVISIGNRAFMNCSSLESITIPSGVTTIGNHVFEDCSSLTSIVLPNSVTSIGNGAFTNCHNLVNIILPDNITMIGGSAFKGCSGLTRITIPDGLNSIYDRTFDFCRELKSITIPDSINYIGRSVFEDCIHLRDITYKGTKKQWEKIRIDHDRDVCMSWDDWDDWYDDLKRIYVHCFDGDIEARF